MATMNDLPLSISEEENEIRIFVRKQDISRLRSMLEALEICDLVEEGPVMSIGRDGKQLVVSFMEETCI